MERNFDGIKLSPEEIMAHSVQNGHITLQQYMEWLMTDRGWESVKKAYMEAIINKAKLQ